MTHKYSNDVRKQTHLGQLLEESFSDFVMREGVVRQGCQPFLNKLL